MSESRSTLSRRQCLFALTATLTSPIVLPAQQQQPNIRAITRYRLKPERAAEFRTVVKEINAVLKKAGHNRASTWWQAQSGPSELVVVIYYSKWAELDTQDAAWKESAADIAPLQARGAQCVDHTERIIDVALPEFSLPRTPDNVPAMISSLRVVVRPERVADYLALQRSEMLPAIQKSGLKTVLFSRTRFGGPNTEFRRVIGMKAWSDLDGTSALVTGMGGAEAYERYLAKIRPMILETEVSVYRHVPELAYVPGK